MQDRSLFSEIIFSNIFSEIIFSNIFFSFNWSTRIVIMIKNILEAIFFPMPGQHIVIIWNQVNFFFFFVYIGIFSYNPKVLFTFVQISYLFSTLSGRFVRSSFGRVGSLVSFHLNFHISHSYISCLKSFMSKTKTE